MSGARFELRACAYAIAYNRVFAIFRPIVPEL